MRRNPAATLINLLQGAAHFSADIFPGSRDLFRALADGQTPHTLFITCADSRISTGMITQSEPGNLFVLRNIGNVVPAYGEMLGGVSAAIEYAVCALQVDTIIVCGHSDCGAMKALLEPDANRLEEMPTVRSWLRNAEAALAVTQALAPPAHARLETMIEQNVLLQLAHLRTHPSVAARIAEGALRLQGWCYDIRHGRIGVIDETSRRMLAIDEALERLHDEGAG